MACATEGRNLGSHGLSIGKSGETLVSISVHHENSPVGDTGDPPGTSGHLVVIPMGPLYSSTRKRKIWLES